MVLTKNLKDAVIETRQKSDDGRFEKIVDIVETNSPSKLKRWLIYESSEIKMMEELLSGTGISFVQDFDPTSGRKNTLLLYVPSLNDIVIDEMENYVKDLLVLRPCSPDENYSQDGDTTEDEEEKDGNTESPSIHLSSTNANCSSQS